MRLSPEDPGFPPALAQKWAALQARISALGSCVVAFSGGVDSGLLCAAAHQALGERMLAVTIQSPVDSIQEREAALALARQLGFPHRMIEHNDLDYPAFRANPPERCYHCKRARLERLVSLAREEGFAAVLEGSNADDERDYRPGKRAVAELGVLSPLAEVGLEKREIRTLARALQLSVAERPSAPCLATRFPYGSPVSEEGLRQVALAETWLLERGYNPVRVRHHGSLARIEVAADQIARLAAEREAVVRFFRSLGFTYISLDLQGYRLGSMNEDLNREDRLS